MCECVTERLVCRSGAKPQFSSCIFGNKHKIRISVNGGKNAMGDG